MNAPEYKIVVHFPADSTVNHDKPRMTIYAETTQATELLVRQFFGMSKRICLYELNSTPQHPNDQYCLIETYT